MLVTFLITFSYFTPSAQWNENSRFNLTRSLVERGKLNIDPFHENTGDKSFYNGHYYSDKAPGMSFLAVPPYALFLGLRRLTGNSGPFQQIEVWPGEPDPDTLKTRKWPRMRYSPAYWLGLYVSNIGTNVLLSAFACTLLFGFLMRRTGQDLKVSLFGTLAYGVAGLSLPYTTLFFGHQAAGSLLLIAFVFLDWAGDEKSALPRWLSHPVRFLVTGGLFGLIVAIEYPASVACVLLGLFALLRAPKGQRVRAAFWMVLGGAPFALLLMIYHTACFGGPFTLGYKHLAHQEFAHGMGQGLYGVTFPRLSVALKILAGTHRGLLYLSPVLALAVIGFVRCWKRGFRSEVGLVLAIASYFIMLNSAYYMWDGGASAGPRHVIPMLGLLAPMVAMGFPESNRPHARWARYGVWVLFILSAANMLAITSVGPEAPLSARDPLMDYAWPRFFAGKISLNVGSSNMGRMLRLPHLLCLLPLLLVWALSTASMISIVKDKAIARK